MKYYAVLYVYCVPNTHNGFRKYLIGMCGDRSHYRLDGRNSLDTLIEDAREWAQKHGAAAFRVEAGTGLLDLQPRTKMITV